MPMLVSVLYRIWMDGPRRAYRWLCTVLHDDPTDGDVSGWGSG
jgi:hypothetical protein